VNNPEIQTGSRSIFGSAMRLDSPDAVEVDGVRQVGEHREHVADGESREDEVGRRRRHAAMRQHDDVENVRHDSEHAELNFAISICCGSV